MVLTRRKAKEEVKGTKERFTYIDFSSTDEEEDLDEYVNTSEEEEKPKAPSRGPKKKVKR